jgi:hypothetical protein
MTLVFLSALLAIGGRLRTLVGAVLVSPLADTVVWQQAVVR